ncbi:CGGC domain-containing protein [uncultured Parabacteroides sp.]|jgi:predicted metal-binding protein|uniref:CGGC domain-containing protein n=1 Tax=uncultured Parabacteroides sp. TaxID=512312 RepID=UPI0025CD03E7|nr:CGGC domain-containing protein [uncultured Parabacteroides sp.]
MKKVGIIRCQQTEDMCPGTTCFKVAIGGKLAFADYGECEIVGFVTCGGCPGKRAVPRAKLLVERGAEVIAFASCVFKGTPIGFACPNAEMMKKCIQKKVGDAIVILDYTH